MEEQLPFWEEKGTLTDHVLLFPGRNFLLLDFFFSEMIRHFNRNIQRLKVNSKMKQLPKNAACLFFPTLTGIHLN